ncbi:DUF6126 family protein [Streptomyces sp. LX-29]|uniref:DUF6126 family protein n=1 Tax=Streptomyces sp. LX-29 TaxID=2900152 RepID=UPI00240DEEA0|nr:DUF6126 family protein [Streptomyces sp. LX-29]WFB06389.1 DUF6126 family protein [Streptomyces sp. LX-29]
MTDETPAAPRPVPVSNGAGTEEYKERGVALRVFIYVVAAHALGAFIWLLFELGASAQK